MRHQCVAVVGAGNLQTCPAVLGSLASYYPDWPFDVRLVDAHPEQLGLAARLMEVLLKDRLAVPPVSSTADLLEGLSGATDVLVTLGTNTARRMVATLDLAHVEALEATPDPFEMRRGDPNRPTPSHRMSEATRELVARPVSALSDSESVAAALELVQAKLSPDTRVAVLGEQVDWAECLAIPHTPPTDDLTAAYQILRWITDDEPADDCFDLAQAWPVLPWLKKSV